MLELIIRDLDLKVIETHQNVDFEIDDGKTSIGSNFLKALNIDTKEFVAGLVLNRPILDKGITIINDGFESWGYFANEEGECWVVGGPERQLRQWEAVYVQEDDERD